MVNKSQNQEKGNLNSSINLDNQNAIQSIMILSRNGMNIFTGDVNLSTATIEPSEQDALFAGFISAILNVSEEVQRSEIRELGFQDTKIIFTLSENLIFMGLTDARVPNQDINNLLDDIVRRYVSEYGDKERPFVSGEMRENIAKMVEVSLKNVFWWAQSEYTFNQNIRYVKEILTRPSGSYFVNFLPNSYLLTGIFLTLLTALLTFPFETRFTGFSVTPANSNTQIRNSIVVVGIIYLGIPAVMKIIDPQNMNYLAFLKLSGVYSLLFSLLFLFGGGLYYDLIYQPAIIAMQGNKFLEGIVLICLFYGPFNIGFFGYIILTGYSGSNVVQRGNTKYYLTYFISILIILSITEAFFGSLIA